LTAACNDLQWMFQACFQHQIAAQPNQSLQV
jgi:hypothetical protein